MNTISDERLAELIEVMRHANQVNASLKSSSKAEDESNKYWVKYNEDCLVAFQELAERRRVDAAVEKMLTVEDGREIEIGPGYANLTRHDGATNVMDATGDDWFAALHKLAEAEELERKDGHER